MIEKLFPIKLPPGLAANGTRYQNAGRWNDGNCVRFHQGTIQPIGGWVPEPTTGATMTGTPQAAISWVLSDGTPVTAVATDQGLYIIDDNDVCYNITPTSGSMHAAPYDWQLSTFGTYLVATNSLLGSEDLSLINVYLWQGTGMATLATPAWLNTVGPYGAYYCFATPERFLAVLRGQDPTGAPARGGVGTAYSERRVYWASQESLNGFISTDTNTGGDFALSTEGRLICGAGVRGQSLLWTDIDLWTMTYIGGDLIYSFANAGRQCGIVSKRAFVVLDKGVFWMGRSKFFGYDGFVRNLPCEVADAVFGDFNQQAAHTVWALPNAQYNEVTWFYPSSGATTPDRYVTYNHEENHWTYGQLARTAGFPLRFRFDIVNPPVPYMWDANGVRYAHETGDERDSLAFLASGPVELGEGDQLARVQGLVPDDKTLGDVQLRIYGAMSPDGLETIYGPFTLAATTPLRLTARQVRLRLEEVNATSWRVGTVRLAALPAERRGPSTTDATDLVPVSIELIPSAVSIDAAEHYTFSYIVRNAEGEVLPIAPDVWTTSDPSVATINSDGTLTVLEAPGSVTVHAQITSHGITSNAAAVTIAPSVPVSITIPSTTTVELGGTTQMTPTVKDARGVTLTDQVVTWTSDSSPITVDSSGVLTGAGPTLGSTAHIQAHIAAHSLDSNVCTATLQQTWIIHQFDAAGTFNVATGGLADDTLVVAGGGSGGSVDGTGVNAGGGGAGELLYRALQTYAPGSYPANIGAGGVPPFADHTIGVGTVVGTNGADTSFNGYTCKGGGGGGASYNPTSGTIRNGVDGGSGGGGASCGDGTQGSGGASTIDTSLTPHGLGNAGRGGANDSTMPGGAGGGAIGSPAIWRGDAFDFYFAGSGGVEYAQGGQTALHRPAGNAPTGPTQGSGGWAGGDALQNQGGSGKHGVVIIRYKLASGIVATGGVKTTIVRTTP